jgi:superfamily II DNA or RNA helicase
MLHTESREIPFFCNLSGTGAGKTLSAILASRVIDSKMTLVVCTNDVVNQWATDERVSITAIFPNSKVITGKLAFDTKYDENKYQYLVLNYDKFSQDDSQDLMLKLVKQRIDFVVLDELQFIKRRHGDKKIESQRRHNLGVLLTEARIKNDQIKVIGMSATPIINDLEEGKSLLQYITGKCTKTFRLEEQFKMPCHFIKSYHQFRSERYQSTDLMSSYMTMMRFTWTGL